MHGGPFRVRARSESSRAHGQRPGDESSVARAVPWPRRQTGAMHARGGGTGGAGALPQVPAAHVRRGHRAGARHRAAVAGAAQRAAQPRLPLLRPARLRQDLQRPHPGPLAQLRAGPHARSRAASATPAARWPPTAPARSTSSRSTRPATAASTTPASCASGRSSPRPAAASRSTSSTRRTWSRPPGFNALLKLVEEPPDYVKFVFATTEPEKVLGTIKSRTHHYPFRLIPPGVLRPYLEQLCRGGGRHGRAGGLPAGGAGRRRQRPGLALRARPAHRRRRPGGRHATPGRSPCSASPTSR